MTESPGETREESFEAALQRLADLVAGLESGSLGLSDSIAAYERGVGILKRLHEQLARAEERVKVLVRIDDEGRPVLEDSGTAEESGSQAGDGPAAQSTQTAATRPARAPRGKPARPPRLPGMDEPDPASQTAE